MQFTSNNYSTFGNGLFVDHLSPACSVNEYYDDPYLYVIGGDTTYIERININRLDAWEVLTVRLDDMQDTSLDLSGSTRCFSPISFENFIYLTPGFINSAPSDEMLKHGKLNILVHYRMHYLV